MLLLGWGSGGEGSKPRPPPPSGAEFLRGAERAEENSGLNELALKAPEKFFE